MRVDRGLPERIGIAQDRIGRGDIKRVLVPGDAEGRIEPREQLDALVDRAIAVRVAQKRDPVRLRLPFRAARSDRHDEVADDVLGTVDGLPGRGLRLNDEHVAIRQGMHRPGVGETLREGGYHETFRHARGLAIAPADHLGHLESRQQVRTRSRQHRIGPVLL